MHDLIIQQTEAGDAAFAVFIMGTTASGKTDLALAINDVLKVEIISVDSALVYRGMDIGTAKPDAAILKKTPHHLIDIIDPTEVYSAGKFRDDALRLMQNSVEKKRIPVLVGGTMLYFNALQNGIAEMPMVDTGVQLAIAEEANKKGLHALHERLKFVDPISAERLHQNDSQRIKRALEIFDFTGKTLSYFWKKQAQNKAKNQLPHHCIKIALVPEDRVELRKRISKRFDLMLQQGFIEEVEGLMKRGDLRPDQPSIRAVGYRQVWAYLSGEYGYDEMRDKAIIATAQLAKRQMTWLRKEAQCNFIEPNGRNTQKVLNKLKVLLS